MATKRLYFVTWLASGSIGCSSRNTCTERSFKNFNNLVQKCKDSLPHLSGGGGGDPRDVIAPFSLFLFSQNANLSESIVIQDFINECNEEGKHFIEIVNKNNVSVLLPRKCLLGNKEFPCMMVGKLSTNWQVSDAQGNDITIVDKNSDLNVDAEFKKKNNYYAAWFSKSFRDGKFVAKLVARDKLNILLTPKEKGLYDFAF